MSVQGVSVDIISDLIVTFSDGTTKNVGAVKGKNGTNGVSVQNVYANGTMSN